MSPKALTDDEDLLRSVLLYHVVPQKLLSNHIKNDMTLDTLLGMILHKND